MSRRFQFSVKALLVGVVILALPVSRLASRMDEKGRQREFVKAFEGRGVIMYDWERANRAKKISRGDPPGWKWVRRLLGDDFFCTVTYVAYQNASDSDLAILARKLPHVEYVVLGPHRGLDPPKPLNTSLTDDGLASIKRLKVLHFLAIKNANVTARGIADFRRSFPNCQVKIAPDLPCAARNSP